MKKVSSWKRWNLWNYDTRCPTRLELIEFFFVEIQNWAKIIKMEGAKKKSDINGRDFKNKDIPIVVVKFHETSVSTTLLCINFCRKSWHFPGYTWRSKCYVTVFWYFFPIRLQDAQISRFWRKRWEWLWLAPGTFGAVGSKWKPMEYYWLCHCRLRISIFIRIIKRKKC